MSLPALSAVSTRNVPHIARAKTTKLMMNQRAGICRQMRYAPAATATMMIMTGIDVPEIDICDKTSTHHYCTGSLAWSPYLKIRPSAN